MLAVHQPQQLGEARVELLLTGRNVRGAGLNGVLNHGAPSFRSSRQQTGP